MFNRGIMFLTTVVQKMNIAVRHEGAVILPALNF